MRTSTKTQIIIELPAACTHLSFRPYEFICTVCGERLVLDERVMERLRKEGASEMVQNIVTEQVTPWAIEHTACATITSFAA